MLHAAKFMFRILIPGLLFFTATFAMAAGDLYNPSPAEGDLIIPGPGGSRFVFRPINVKGRGPLSGTRFIMGDPAGDFRNTPTAVVVGGTFPDKNDPERWIYYLGKYEVTEAQYYAVLGLPPGADKNKRSSCLPVTGVSYFDAMRFIDALNTWLYANAMKSLPVSGPFPAFVRLPTEVEWEFAARGGAEVEGVVFDAEYPYTDLVCHEWFAGPSSSHNKIQPIGKLLPNPLGLHDMLGNVREITQSHYYVEYYQGRGGGFTVRGGHYLMQEEQMQAALRSEEPYYLGTADTGMSPNTKPTMGFRLMLGAPVLTGRQTIRQMEAAWEDYRDGAGAILPAALSVSAVSSQEAVPAKEALDRLQRINKTLQAAGLADSLRQDIAATEAALRSMAQVRKQADEDSARVWAKIAGERGMYLAINLKHLARVRKAPTENMRRRAEQISYNVNAGLENYGEIMSELGKLPKNAVLKGFDGYADFLQAKIDKEKKADSAERPARVRDIKAQLAHLKTTRKHYEKYEKEKRFDAAGWRMDYSPVN